MKFFLDSAIVDEITYALDMWDIDGVTTNPRHVQVAGKPFMAVIKEIGSIFSQYGPEEKTVSVEINPHHDNPAAMIAEAEKLAALCDNFVIKVPSTEAGFKTCAELSRVGIRANVTLCFSAAQALQAMRMGAYYVSPFIGWKESNAEETRSFIEDLIDIRDNYMFETQVLVAAIRNGRQIVDAAAAGADIATAGFAVYKDAFDHPYTHVGLEKFISFWDQTEYE